MKVAELEGAQLDYWVARANGWRVNPDFPNGGWRYLNEDPKQPFPAEWHGEYKPSSDWSIGGPIIERERIAIEYTRSSDSAMAWCAIHDGLFDYGDDGPLGPTPLVAAMRAYVASKFGDEVPNS